MTKLLFYKSDGTEMAFGATLASGTNYFAKVPIAEVGPVTAGVDFEWDASIIVTYTIEGTNDDTATIYEATGQSWKARTALGSIIVPGGSASGDGFEIDAPGFARYRVKAAVGGTGGVQTGRAMVRR